MMNNKLKEKKDVAEKIYKNTEEQTKVIDLEDEGSLLHLLDERQRLLDELAIISKEIQDGEQEGNTEDQEQMKKEIQEILQKAYDQELRNQKKLEEIKDKLYKEIQDFQYGQKAMNEGYRKQQASTYGYFIDKKN